MEIIVAAGVVGLTVGMGIGALRAAHRRKRTAQAREEARRLLAHGNPDPERVEAVLKRLEQGGDEESSRLAGRLRRRLSRDG